MVLVGVLADREVRVKAPIELLRAAVAPDDNLNEGGAELLLELLLLLLVLMVKLEGGRLFRLNTPLRLAGLKIPLVLSF